MPHGYSLKSQPPLYLLLLNSKAAKVNQNDVKRHPEKDFSPWLGAQKKSRNAGGNGKAGGHGGELMPLREEKQAEAQAKKPILPPKLKNSISEFLMDDNWLEPLTAAELKEDIREFGINRGIRQLGKVELEALWMDLRLEENRAHSEWMREFHSLNPGINLVFVEREVEHPVFAEFSQLMDYISKSRDLPTKVAQKHLQELGIGAWLAINGRKDMEYIITRTEDGWHCAKKDCHLELTGETLVPENLDASKASIAGLDDRVARLDALFFIMSRCLQKKYPESDLPDRNSGSLLANMGLARALVNQAIYLRDSNQ
ncbi:MAG: hypothetical protein WCT52_03645 [Candidatus Micrarchaeia archaeon]